MASDIATVGTALEVADGYKIQFNFYTNSCTGNAVWFYNAWTRYKM